MSCSSISSTELCRTGTGIIKFFILDEDNNITIPVTIYWQLSDKYGNIIEGFSYALNDITGTEQTITITDSSGNDVTGSGFVIILTGEDLDYDPDTDDGVRYISVKGTYNSQYGSGLTFISEKKFEILNLINS